MRPSPCRDAPTRSAEIIAFPTRPARRPAPDLAAFDAAEARLRHAAEALAAAGAEQCSAFQELRQATAPLHDHLHRLADRMERLSPALAHLEAGVRGIGEHARRLERLMDAALSGRGPDPETAAAIRRGAPR